MVSASDLLIGVETRSFDVVFFVRYQFWFANGTGYQYDGAHCSELSNSVQKVYELLFFLWQIDRLFRSFWPQFWGVLKTAFSDFVSFLIVWPEQIWINRLFLFIEEKQQAKDSRSVNNNACVVCLSIFQGVNLSTSWHKNTNKTIPELQEHSQGDHLSKTPKMYTTHHINPSLPIIGREFTPNGNSSRKHTWMLPGCFLLWHHQRGIVYIFEHIWPLGPNVWRCREMSTAMCCIHLGCLAEMISLVVLVKFGNCYVRVLMSTCRQIDALENRKTDHTSVIIWHSSSL